MKLTIRLGNLEKLVVAVGLLMIGLLVYSRWFTTKIFNESEPLIVISSTLKIKIALAHLWFEEAMAGDPRINLDQDVYAHLDGALGLCQMMFEGGITDSGRIRAFTNPETRKNVAILVERIREFRDISAERWKLRATSRPGNPLESRHDAVFRDILQVIDENGRITDQMAAHQQAIGRWIDTAIMLLSLLLLAGFLFLAIRNLRFTQEKNTELAQSHLRFSIVTRATNDAVWDWNLETDAVWWNEGVQSLFGYKPGEVGLDSQWWSENIHPEDRPNILSSIQKVFDSGQRTWSGEYRFHRADGSFANVFDRGYIVYDGGGKPVRMLGAMVDITVRKRAEEALSSKTDILTALTEALVAFLERGSWKEAMARLLRCAVSQTESEYGFIGVLVEGPVLRILAHEGIVWDEIINRDFYDQAIRTYHEVGYLEFKNFKNLFGEVVINGHVVVSNEPDRDPRSGGRPAGHPPMHSFLGVPIYSSGKLVGMIGVANRAGGYSESDQAKIETLVREAGILCDSYLRQEREAALKAEQKEAQKKIQEQAALLDKARDAILLRVPDDRILYWNQSAERLYGWKSEEAVSKNANELLYRSKADAPQEAIRAIQERGEWLGELTQVTKEGKEILVESRWTLVRDENGRPKSILVVNTDVTESKKLEAQFFRAQRMESIGALASGIAHDLNNVLSPIMMGVQILQSETKDASVRNILATMETSALRGAGMVKQVITFARGLEGERGVIQPRHLIHDMVKIARQTFPKSIEFKTRLEKDLWTCLGDATQIHQVLLNLFVNARDAMPNGGAITIEAENVHIDGDIRQKNPETKPGPYLRVTISDTGVGIPPDVLGRIFEPFFTTKEPGKGTGLGLSTVMGILKNHEGLIEVDSIVGRGTSFKIYLPAQVSVAEERISAEQTALPLGRGELILVVDDEAAIREMCKAILESHEYKVLTAEDGAEAVAIYAEHKNEVQVVLMDMMMPIMDGRSTIQALRRIRPQVKIVSISGSEEEKVLAMAEELKVHTSLPKPLTTESLLFTLNRILSKT